MHDLKDLRKNLNTLKKKFQNRNIEFDIDNFNKIDPCGLNSKDISSLKELKINYNKVKIYKDLKEEFMKVFY